MPTLLLTREGTILMTNESFEQSDLAGKAKNFINGLPEKSKVSLQ